jgi:hypothetical protein
MHDFVSGPLNGVVAGADLAYKPSTSSPWKLLSMVATLTTSAVVGARAPTLQFLDQNGTLVLAIPASGTTAASLATVYSWYVAGSPSPGAGAVGGGYASGVLPSFWLPAGWSVKTKTVAIDVGDAWTLSYATALVSDRLSVGEINALLALSGAS